MRHPSLVVCPRSGVALRALFGFVLDLDVCDDDKDVTMLFDRCANDPTRHVFPTDEYKGDVVLDAFSEAEIALDPFVQQLRYTAQLGWAPTTAVRLPFTPAPDDPDRWIDVDSVRE